MRDAYAEFGLDFDNNKFGLGYSTEVENPDGTEFRVKRLVKMRDRRFYFRIWIGRKVWVLSGKGVKILRKPRNNFKMVFGIAGRTAEPLDPR